MPIAPAAKGIIIVSGVLIAAAAALYENDQIREWFERTRTDITQSFQDWLDSLTPEGQERLRRRAGAHAMGAHAMSPGTTVTTRISMSSSSTASGRGRFEQDTERRRLGQEYLERRKKLMEAKAKRKGVDPAEETGESIQMEDGPSRAAVTGADVQSGSNNGVRRRRSSALQPLMQQATQTPQAQQGQTERYPEATNVIAAGDADAQALQRHSEAEDTDVDADSHISISMTSADFFDAEPSPDQATPTFRAATTPAVPDTAVPLLDISPSTSALSTSNIQAHNETFSHANAQQGQLGNHGVLSTATSTQEDGGVDNSTDTDADHVSEAGTETASHVSRLSELDDPMHSAREDDVMSISSGGDWSEVSSAVSEDR